MKLDFESKSNAGFLGIQSGLRVIHENVVLYAHDSSFDARIRWNRVPQSHDLSSSLPYARDSSLVPLSTGDVTREVLVLCLRLSVCLFILLQARFDRIFFSFGFDTARDHAITSSSFETFVFCVSKKLDDFRLTSIIQSNYSNGYRDRR